MLIRVLCVLPVLLALAVAPGSVPAQEPIVVGASVSQSGLLADLAADYRKALLLWQDEVNAAGGLLGRRVALDLADDHSSAAEVARIYRGLTGTPHADLLIGPYGSAATLRAAVIAERARRVMVNGTGAMQARQNKRYRYVFQVAAPFSAYGAGALEIARREGYRTVIVLARDDPGARAAAEGFAAMALAQGIKVEGPEMFGPGTSEFAPQVKRARSVGAQAWIAFGGLRDAADMVKTFRRENYAPAMFLAQGAGDPRFLREVGQDAEYAIGLSAYEPRFRTDGNAAFVQAFVARWSAEPGLAAAQGYAAAKILEQAVRSAGTLETERVRQALGAIQTQTPLGAYKIDGASGRQMAAQVALVQVHKGRRTLIWPEALATAKWIMPYPPWSERKLLKSAGE